MNFETAATSQRADLWWARGDTTSVAWGFTSRRAGFSSGVYSGLNLGAHVGDDPATVERNRIRVANAMGVEPGSVVYAHQVHGSEVAHVTARTSEPPTADSLITTDEVALAVMVADCVPVLAWSADGAVRGIAHAGRPGMHAGVVGRMLEGMADLGATRLHVQLGPSICPRCYEVPADLRDVVSQRRHQTSSTTRWGTPAIDVAGGVLADIEHYMTKGLVVQCATSKGCTFEEQDLYSYRRDGTTGRLAGYIWPRLP